MTGAPQTDRPEADSAPLLSVKDLNVRFVSRAGDVHAVRDVSFDIRPGEILALVGESGSGKSVTALSCLKLLPASARIDGSILFGERQVVEADEETMRDIRGDDATMIFQEPMTSLNPLHIVEKQIAESLALHQGLVGPQARKRVLELLDQVGIRDPESRLASYPHQLSGGQRQRVMIAMALANNPKLLIADEPTTALDVTIQAQILALLKELQRSRRMAMLFITHDLGVVRKFADRVCVMENGRIVEAGSIEEVFSSPEHPYTQRLLAAEPRGEAEPAYRHAEELIGARDLKVWFPIKRGLLRRVVGHVKAVQKATLSVRAGETLGVVGESGSGKTTLGLALLRLTSSEGAITFMGERIDGVSGPALRARRADMQIVFQDPYGALSPRLSVGDIIGEGLEVHPDRAEADAAAGRMERREIRRAAIADALIEVGLEPAMMERYPHEFSGGQRQRIAIARAMILKPKLVILDEPTSALDMTVQTQIVDLLRRLQKRYGLAYIFISHDLRVVRAMSHRIIVMREGEIVEQGAAQAVIEAPKTDYTRALMAAAFDLESSGAVDTQ